MQKDDRWHEPGLSQHACLSRASCSYLAVAAGLSRIAGSSWSTGVTTLSPAASGPFESLPPLHSSIGSTACFEKPSSYVCRHVNLQLIHTDPSHAPASSSLHVALFAAVLVFTHTQEEQAFLGPEQETNSRDACFALGSRNTGKSGHARSACVAAHSAVRINTQRGG
jgi:hypothetical protein